MTFSASPRWYDDMYVLHFTPSKTPPKGTVFILHGYPSLGRKNYDFAEVVAANNYEVYVPHYPGLGLSKGQFGFLASPKRSDYVPQPRNWSFWLRESSS